MKIPFEKRNGEVVNEQMLITKLRNQFQTLMNGEYDLSIEKKKKKRSLDQNRLLWLWITCISHETGQDKMDIYDYYCKKFLSRMIVIKGEEIEVSSSSSKLSTIQMKEFLEKIQSDASAELGIILPTPNDLYWNEFENYYSGLMIIN